MIADSMPGVEMAKIDQHPAASARLRAYLVPYEKELVRAMSRLSETREAYTNAAKMAVGAQEAGAPPSLNRMWGPQTVEAEGGLVQHVVPITLPGRGAPGEASEAPMTEREIDEHIQSMVETPREVREREAKRVVLTLGGQQWKPAEGQEQELNQLLSSFRREIEPLEQELATKMRLLRALEAKKDELSQSQVKLLRQQVADLRRRHDWYVKELNESPRRFPHVFAAVQ
jgi:hypothetical protein